MKTLQGQFNYKINRTQISSLYKTTVNCLIYRWKAELSLETRSV